MKILERQIKHVFPDKHAEREAMIKENPFAAIESKYGFPPPRSFILISGPDEMGTEVLEREWPSMAAYETAIEKVNADPAYQALGEKFREIIRDTRMEYYFIRS